MTPTSAFEHCRVVLGGILPNRSDLLDVALAHLGPEHFPDTTLRVLFSMLQRYVEATGFVMTRAALADLLSRTDRAVGVAEYYQETFDELCARPVSEGEFRWSLGQVRELAAERATTEALTTAMEILNHGIEGPKDTRIEGHRAAREHALAAFAEVDRALVMREAPEGDIRTEGAEFLAEYELRRKQAEAGISPGVMFGIAELDDTIGGLQLGELDLIVGATAAGKSSLAVQLAWNAAIVQGFDVVYITTETLRPQIHRKVIARHSRLPRFDIPEGLNTRDLRRASLPPAMEDKLREVVADFESDPSYGHLDLVQLPKGATVSMVGSQVARLGRTRALRLVIMDYAQLLTADRRRTTDREELSSIVKDLKWIASTYGDGRGLTLVSPWQVSRTAYEKAQSSGSYTLTSTAETAESSNTSDVVVSILEPPEMAGQRYVDLLAQVLKNRDGERGPRLKLHCDYATSYFTSRQRPSSMEELLV